MVHETILQSTSFLLYYLHQVNADILCYFFLMALRMIPDQLQKSVSEPRNPEAVILC